MPCKVNLFIIISYSDQVLVMDKNEHAYSTSYQQRS